MRVTGKFVLVCTVFATCYNQIMCANILYMSLMPSRSHAIWDKTIAMALREKGHQITFVTPTNEKSMENFTTIVVEGLLEKIEKHFNYAALQPPYAVIQLMRDVYDWFTFISEQSINTNGIQQLMNQANDNVRYDLIIYDVGVGQCFYPFIEKFNSPPVVATSPFGIWPFFNLNLGIEPSAAYIPHKFMPYSDEMTYFQRLNNYFGYLLYLFWHHFVYMPAQWKLAQKLFGKNITHYTEIEKNFSIALINYDPTLDYPQPLPPGVIPCGGLTTMRENSLPQDLQKYLDNARNGAILFSLGTSIRSDLISKPVIDALMKAFSQLNQTVLWKYESHVDNIPENVIIRPWLAQNDILAHPNVKLFVTHGGGLSIQEAIYHKVPLVGIPFFPDHHSNMRKVVQKKWGVELLCSAITSQTILVAIKEVMNNQVYKENVQKASRRFRDQPEDPLTRAVYWVEYTLRHAGAHHLTTKARTMPWYQVYHLDAWVFVAAAITAICYAICKFYLVLFKFERNNKLKSN